MPKLPITLIKGDKVSSRVDYLDNLPTNMYAVPKDILEAKGFMVTYPGIDKSVDSLGIDRGGFYNSRFDKHFRVSGTNLIEVATDSSITFLGAITGDEQVQFANSFNTQAIVADKKMYLYGGTSGFRQITDSDVGEPLDVTWINGYYFLTDGEYIYHTDINDEDSIDSLQYAVAEFMPDPSVGVGKTSDNKVIVFGRYSIEYFQDVASSSFAFTRIESRALKLGTISATTKTQIGDSWFFIGGARNEGNHIYVLASGVVNKISVRLVDILLSKYSDPDLKDARVEAWSSEEDTFVIFHLPEETVLFNKRIAEQFGLEYAWSILHTGITGSKLYRGINIVYDPRTGKWVVGDKFTHTLGELDFEKFSQYDEQQEFELFSPLVNLESMSVDEIELSTIPGFNINTENIKVATSLTYDGLSYGTEFFKLYSSQYNYSTRYILYRLGYINDMVGFKFRGISKSKAAFGLFTVTYG